VSAYDRKDGLLGAVDLGRWEDGMVGALVTGGLLGTWLIHDAEEWVTMPGWSQRVVASAARRYPRVPGRVLSFLRISRLEATIAIGSIGLLVTAACAAGISTGGRSAFFQLVLMAFGLHSIVHVLQTVAARGYTPGVVTAVILVAPYSWYAWQQVRQARIVSLGESSWATAIALFAIAVLGARLLAIVVGRLRLPSQQTGSR
jgi:hypothetical protein